MLRTKEEVSTVLQLITSMEEALEKLEEAKKKSKVEDFKKIKEFILKLQARISEELR